MPDFPEEPGWKTKHEKFLEELLAEKMRREEVEKVRVPSLEEMLTGPRYFGLTTASPLQRAICRIIDGQALGTLAKLESLKNALGCDPALLPEGQPDEVVMLSGIRTAKSMMVAAAAIRWTQACTIPHYFGHGDIPRVSIVSLTKDLADVVYGHIVQNAMASEAIKKWLYSEPQAYSVMFRHPTGRPVEISVVAGSRAGASLVARWSAGCIFDEFPRMVGAEDGVVNWNDSRRAVIARLLEGAQVLSIGSPWSPEGPAYEQYIEHYSHPTKHVVFLKTPAWDMNPVYWTPKQVEEAKRDPYVYQTDVAADFAAPEESLFSSVELAECTRKELAREPEQDLTYRAAMDPAARGNSWTFVVATRRGRRKMVVFNHQWTGSPLEPLRPRAVFEEIREICRKYRITQIDTDQYMVDALKDIASEIGLFIHYVPMNEKEKGSRYLSIKARLAEGEIELPPDPVFRTDLQRLRKRAMKGGGYQVMLPRSKDGRHCDYAPSFLLAVSPYIEDEQTKMPDLGSRDFIDQMAAKVKAERLASVADDNEAPWWRRRARR